MNIFSNVGITELIVILLLALLVVGPERLPELARQLAKVLRDARTAYENLTKDLGPELMSIEKTTREIRESVNSVRSIPKDMVGSVVKAADLDDTIADLKDVQKSVEEAGRSVSKAGRMIQEPLDETLKTARGALDPAKDTAQPEGQPPAAGTDTAEEPVSESHGAVEATEVEPDQAVLSAPDGAGQETDAGETTSQGISDKEAGDGSSPEGAEDEHAGE
jgi:sec-independent protein translocase protein TatB